jgi:hypothetical protein
MPMRHPFSLPLGMILVGAAMAAGGARTLVQSGANSSHSHDGVTITAQAWTDPANYKPKFPKKNPLSGGIVGVQFTLQNDSPDTARVNLERIRLVVTLEEDTRQNLAPLSPEDVADAVLTSKPRDPTAKRSRIPIPMGRPPAGRSKAWMELEQAARNAGVPSSVVAGHAKIEGLLYFDIGSQFDLLNSARLYVPEVTLLEKGKPLIYFEVELSKPAQK